MNPLIKVLLDAFFSDKPRLPSAARNPRFDVIMIIGRDYRDWEAIADSSRNVTILRERNPNRDDPPEFGLILWNAHTYLDRENIAVCVFTEIDGLLQNIGASFPEVAAQAHSLTRYFMHGQTLYIQARAATK